jgi:Rrf2 family nitric oxide-sensitive transcriptional repressor
VKLTTFTDYSLRVLIYLAARPQVRATIGQVAAAHSISENHLVKVVHLLGRHGWLRNTRGKGGGFELALEPGRIPLGTVIRQTEGHTAVADCFEEDGGNCSLAPDCRLRGVLAEAADAFNRVLDHYTLADLVSDAAAPAKVLFVERSRVRKAA